MSLRPPPRRLATSSQLKTHTHWLGHSLRSGLCNPPGAMEGVGTYSRPLRKSTSSHASQREERTQNSRQSCVHICPGHSLLPDPAATASAQVGEDVRAYSRTPYEYSLPQLYWASVGELGAGEDRSISRRRTCFTRTKILAAERLPSQRQRS